MEDSVDATAGERKGKTVTIEAGERKFHVRSYCEPEFIETMEMDSGIGVFPQYRSIIRGKDTLANLARRPNSNVVLAYTDDLKIVGYIVITTPDPMDRWGKGDATGLLEFGALEVSRNWRRFGVARALMDMAFNDESIEDKIVLSMEYAWHWDLEGSGLTKAQYRDRLLRLLKKYGFQQFPTNEPNILLDPANMLTARVGSKVSNAVYLNFQTRLFGTDVPWAKAID